MEPKIIAISSRVSIAAGAMERGNRKPAKFTSTFYSGGRVKISGLDTPVVIDLSGLIVGKTLVANLDHDSRKRVGNFSVTNDGRTLVANGTASAASAARNEVVGSALDGFQWQSAIEAFPGRLEPIAAGQTVTVNDQQFTGPIFVARRATLKGMSFGSHDEDDGGTVAIAAGIQYGREMSVAEVHAGRDDENDDDDSELSTMAGLSKLGAEILKVEYPIYCKFRHDLPGEHIVFDQVAAMTGHSLDLAIKGHIHPWRGRGMAIVFNAPVISANFFGPGHVVASLQQCLLHELGHRRRSPSVEGTPDAEIGESLARAQLTVPSLQLPPPDSDEVYDPFIYHGSEFFRALTHVTARAAVLDVDLDVCNAEFSRFGLSGWHEYYSTLEGEVVQFQDDPLDEALQAAGEPSEEFLNLFASDLNRIRYGY